MTHLYALHGFFGSPRDWDLFEWERVTSFTPMEVYRFAQGGVGLIEAAKRLNQSIATKRNTLMGYSLGGRLALHALLENPKQWSAAVIVSAHPGLLDPQERKQRLASDLHWSQKILSMPWNDLLDEWNRQPVLATSQNAFPRESSRRMESLFDRKLLSDLLCSWSLGNQNHLNDAIKDLNLPILWVVGERDIRYVALANQLQFSHPRSRVWIAPNAGHRVPWDINQIFYNEVLTFLKEAEEKNDNSNNIVAPG